jgi:hypothetical protein
MMDEDFEDEAEGGDTLHAYVFIPRANLNGVYADRFTDVSSMLGKTADQFEELLRVYTSMGMEKENIEAIRDVPMAVTAMVQRLLMRCDNTQAICLVKTEEPLTGEEMDMFLCAKQREGKLAEFIRRSRMY